MKVFTFASLFFFLSYVNAQTVTTTDLAGQTVVEVITVDPDLVPTTQILATLTATLANPTLADPDDDDTTTTNTATTALTATSTSTTSTSTSTSTTSTTTPAPVQQGPVGAPPATTATPGGVTPYTYTTTDANGDITRVVAEFTPTSPTTIPPVVKTSGTIWDYSSWAAIYATGSAVAQNSSTRKLSPAFGGWWSIGMSGISVVLGGAWLMMI